MYVNSSDSGGLLWSDQPIGSQLDHKTLSGWLTGYPESTVNLVHLVTQRSCVIREGRPFLFELFPGHDYLQKCLLSLCPPLLLDHCCTSSSLSTSHIFQWRHIKMWEGLGLIPTFDQGKPLSISFCNFHHGLEDHRSITAYL